MDETVVDTAARALLDAVPAGSRVILFGSHAEGRARPDSDLDFLVVEPEVEDRFTEIIRLRRVIDVALKGMVQPVDVLVMDQNRYKRKSGVPNTIAYEAAAHGRIYERSS